MKKIIGVILAAGKGTRINAGRAAPIPKVMFSLIGKPMIRYCVDHVRAAGVSDIVLVVGYRRKEIEDYFKNEVGYAVQEEQLGTGHALMQAEDLLSGKSEAVMVCYGDMPLFKPKTIKKLILEYEKEKPAAALLSVVLSDPMAWAFGRIIRNQKGEVIGSIEQKDCSPKELEIKECTTCFYIFRSEWLWKNLKKLKTKNAQHEYYLTDLVEIAAREGEKIIALPVSEESEASGVNTKEQLSQAEKILSIKEEKCRII